MSPAEEWDGYTNTEILFMIEEDLHDLLPPLTREQWHLTKWCDHCKHGDHYMCTGVDCYECRHPDHRFQGMTRLGNRDAWQICGTRQE